MIDIQLIYEAYRKFKSNVYYDSNSLLQKRKNAEFEDGMRGDNGEISRAKLKDRMQRILDLISNVNNPLDQSTFLNSLLEKVSFTAIPKSVESASHIESKDCLITNTPDYGPYTLNEYNLLIDAPVEIHIIAIVWIMTVGIILDKKIERHNYAYRLAIKETPYPEDKDFIDVKNERISSGLMLFKPYYESYQNWRDNALQKAQSILDDHDNASIIGLDIKRYFYSVRMNLLKEVDIESGELKKDFESYVLYEHLGLYKRLNNILHLIHLEYARKAQEVSPIKLSQEEIESGKVPLPVGLESSGILGNFYLRKFDEEIIRIVNPAYYGRYVDDMLLVFRNRKLSLNNSSRVKAAEIIRQFIHENFVERGILHPDNDPTGNDSKDDTTYCLNNYDNLKIQGGKVILEHFDHRESRAAINKFKKNIDRNRSEFRFLPFEDSIDIEFDDEAFSLEYKGSVNKLRDVKSLTEDRFGASKFLAHKLFLSTFPVDKDKKDIAYLTKSASQILTYFKGVTVLDMWMLWEKVASYFMLNNDSESLLVFYRQAFKAIKDIKVNNVGAGNSMSQRKEERIPEEPEESNAEDTVPNSSFQKYIFERRFEQTLQKFLNLAVAAAYSLCPGEIDKINFKKNIKDEIRKDALSFRRSFQFRHNLLRLQALPYTKFNTGDNDLRNISDDDLQKCEYVKGNVSLIAPIFIHFHDFNLLHVLRCTQTSTGNNSSAADNDAKSQYETVWNNYFSFNYEWRTSFKDNKIKNSDAWFAIVKETPWNNLTSYYWEIPDLADVQSSSFARTIGIANWKVNEQDFISSAKGCCIKSKEKRTKLFEIINTAIRHHVSIVILPELALPIEWLPLLVQQAYRHNIAFITGIDYTIRNNDVYNHTATILPIKTKNYTTALIRLRLKNSYSPGEMEFVRGLKKSIPKVGQCYDLFHWRGVYFSVYNCFELTNIQDRSLFKGKVDFIVASEFNKDIPYFSNISESLSRDLHCYVAQVNSSQFGDSRIVQPSKSYNQNLLSVKGGIYPVLLIEQLDIPKLRDFQLHAYNWQLKDGSDIFKPTPSGFETQHIIARSQNKNVTEEPFVASASSIESLSSYEKRLEEACARIEIEMTNPNV